MIRKQLAIGADDGLVCGQLKRDWIAAFPVQWIEKTDPVATGKNSSSRVLKALAGGSVDPVKSVLNIPGFLADKDHASRRAPQRIAIHVQAHENPAIREWLNRILIFAIKACDGCERFSSLQDVFVSLAGREAEGFK